MNQYQQPLPPDESSDDAIDDLIRRALEGHPQAEGDLLRLQRLEDTWLAASRRQARWRRIGGSAAAAVAASLLLAISLVVRSGEEPNEPIAVAENHVAKSLPPLVPTPPEPERVVVESPARIDAPFSGRAPTDYERWMFAAQTRTRVTPAAPTLAEVVDEVTNQRAVSLQAMEMSAARRFAAFERAEIEDALLRTLREPHDDRHLQTVKLLTSFGSQRAVAPLLEASLDESLRTPALDAVESIVGVDQLPELIRVTEVSRARPALINWLLDAQTEDALVAFLRLVHDDSLRSVALATAMDRQDLPIAGLVALLDHNDSTVRFATSLALGELNRCEMTDALITRVSERPSKSKEAWFALFGCRCDSAATFLAHAARTPQLLGQLNNAKIQWSLAMP